MAETADLELLDTFAAIFMAREDDAPSEEAMIFGNQYCTCRFLSGNWLRGTSGALRLHMIDQDIHGQYQ